MINEELLMTEGYNRRNSPHHKRTYWLEEDEQWALVMDHAIDDEQITPEVIHWVARHPMEQAFAHDFEEEEETYYDGIYDSAYDGEWHASLDDGSYVAYSEMKPWLEIENVMAVDAELGKELYEIYSNFENKARTFREARWAMHQKGKNRGFFKPKGKGKGKSKKGFKGINSVVGSPPKNPIFFSKGSGKASTASSVSPVNKPGYSGCFICGDLQHDFCTCPKQSQGSSPGQKGTGKMIGLVEDVPDGCMSGSEYGAPSDAYSSIKDLDAHDNLFLEGGNGDIHMTEDAEGDKSETDGEDVTLKILAAQEALSSDLSPAQRLQYAVVDTGATETVGPLDALDAVMAQRGKVFGQEQVKVDAQKQKQFKFGTAQVHRAESLISCLRK